MHITFIVWTRLKSSLMWLCYWNKYNNKTLLQCSLTVFSQYIWSDWYKTKVECKGRVKHWYCLARQDSLLSGKQGCIDKMKVSCETYWFNALFHLLFCSSFLSHPILFDSVCLTTIIMIINFIRYWLTKLEGASIGSWYTCTPTRPTTTRRMIVVMTLCVLSIGSR